VQYRSRRRVESSLMRWPKTGFSAILRNKDEVSVAGSGVSALSLLVLLKGTRPFRTRPIPIEIRSKSLRTATNRSTGPVQSNKHDKYHSKLERPLDSRS
jgi:hypothetical protein